MQKILIPIITSLIGIAGLVGFISTEKAAPARTEDYAVLNVFQDGKRNYISLTVGSNPTQQREFHREKTEQRYDLAPILREMENLNQQGFELVNSSTAIIPAGVPDEITGGNPFYTFTFKRKLQK
ncbi:hypothetical protein [Adhaeribacter soli]|uniref:Uncharacterized protein n=1 Tax=Adhaeribacter soli TaxID=2607655 RepID=A0A5N1IZ10_9BACT|nr:hypothetical protein [Adhaeribacter soli]KAA9333729.1 hypothetical protein F0P94_10805 [Adhaeribacter soli]